MNYVQGFFSSMKAVLLEPKGSAQENAIGRATVLSVFVAGIVAAFLFIKVAK